MPNPDKRYGVAVRLSDDAARNKPAKKGFFSHFATLPRKKKNQVQFWTNCELQIYFFICTTFTIQNELICRWFLQVVNKIWRLWNLMSNCISFSIGFIHCTFFHCLFQLGGADLSKYLEFHLHLFFLMCLQINLLIMKIL